MAKYYSIAKCGFYDDAFKSSYDATDSWPNDVIEITTEQAVYFYEAINNGCRIYQDGVQLLLSKPCSDKYHCWDTINNEWTLTEQAAQQRAEDLVKITEAEKENLINTAMQTISLLQLKLQAGCKLSSDETTKLNAVLD